eukprot:NODE_247_length_11822_cov_1.182718.p8 type:complete len:218 gc:universal NODE_247_length_11822_cov_1.182718:4885-5538(+)
MTAGFKYKIVDSKDMSEYIIKLLMAMETEHDKLTIGIAGSFVASLLVGLKPKYPQNWYFILADGHFVPFESRDSILLHLSQIPIPRKNIILFDQSLDCKSAAIQYEEFIKPYLPLKIYLLGIGVDGHVCSLFPGHRMLQSERIVDFIEDSPKNPPRRISLTLKTMNDHGSKRVIVVGGSQRLEVVKKIYHHDKSIPAANLENCIWLLDENYNCLSDM